MAAKIIPIKQEYADPKNQADLLHDGFKILTWNLHSKGYCLTLESIDEVLDIFKKTLVELCEIPEYNQTS